MTIEGRPSWIITASNIHIVPIMAKKRLLKNNGKTCYGLELLTDKSVRLYLNGNDIRKEILPLLKIKCVQSVDVTSEVIQSKTSNAEDAALKVPEEMCNSKNNRLFPQESTSPSEDIFSTSQKEAFDICSSLLTETINTVTEEVSLEENPRKAAEVCNEADPNSDNDIDNTSNNKYENPEKLLPTEDITSVENIVPDAPQSDNINEEDREVCDNTYVEGEMPNLCNVPLKKEIEKTEDLTTVVCDNLQKQQNHQVTLEESDETNKYSDSSEKKYDNPEEIFEECQIPQETEICLAPNTASFDTSQKLSDGDDIQICNTSNANNDNEETPELCDAPSETFSNVPTNITKDVSLKEHSETSEILQEMGVSLIEDDFELKESHDDGEEKAIEVCDDNLGNKNLLEVCDGLINEACSQQSPDVATEILNEILQRTEVCEISKEERNLLQEACNIPSHGGDCDEKGEKKDNLEEICNEGVTREITDGDKRKIPTNCNANETKENIEAVSQPSDTLHEIVQQEESQKIAEESSDTCYDGVMKEITNYDEKKTNKNIKGACETKTHFQNEEMDVTKPEDDVSRASDTPQEESQEIAEESSNMCDRLEKVEPCSATSDMEEQNSPIILSEETKSQITDSRVEFTETIMTSFSAPTISEKESERKLSPTKITPKLKEVPGEAAVDDSQTKEE